MLGFFFIGWVVCGVIAGMIASGKRRSGCGFFILGLLFGPLAILAAAVMSTDQAAVTRAALASGDMLLCPACRSPVPRLASKCAACQATFQPTPYPLSAAERLGRLLAGKDKAE